MNNLILISSGFLNLILAICLYLTARQRNSAMLGQRKWREIAFHHDAEARRFTDLKNEQINQLKTGGEQAEAVWLERFNSLLIALWGAPALDRNMRDVIKRIAEMREELFNNQSKINGLAAMAQSYDRKAKASEADALALIGRVRELEEAMNISCKGE